MRRLQLLEQPLDHLHAWFVFGALAQPESLPERLPRIVHATQANTRHCIQRPQPRTLPTGVAGLAQRQHRLTVIAASAMPPRSSRQCLVVRLFARRAGARFGAWLSQPSCHESMGTTLGQSESCATRRKIHLGGVKHLTSLRALRFGHSQNLAPLERMGGAACRKHTH